MKSPTPEATPTIIAATAIIPQKYPDSKLENRKNISTAAIKLAASKAIDLVR